ncbi:NAD(P)-binding protein [Aspergillus ambiguus]|uniref:putative short-chain dehydrogenase/reductase family protein n=1 Tax=Aspergillus ambiguus TaxID=176160 RepID=UPI003CCCC797
MSIYLRFLCNQFFVHPTVPADGADTFADQVVIVTGANVGLGLEASRHIARLGAQKVILAVRNVAAGEAARESIETSTGRAGVCEVWPLDLASYASVQAFAQRAAQLPRLDVVVENAAVATRDYQRAEGHELTVTVNVLSTMLLGLLLLPTLRESARRHPLAPKPRLAIVVSEVHAWTSLPERAADRILDTLSDEASADMDMRYPTSKLLAVFAVREMVRRLRDDAVVVNMLNPGFCHSQLTRDSNGLSIKAMKMLLARSTEEGSRTLVAAAAAGPESHGQYMENGVVAPHAVSAFVCSDEGEKTQARVWGEIAEILEGVQPGVLENL